MAKRVQHMAQHTAPRRRVLWRVLIVSAVAIAIVAYCLLAILSHLRQSPSASNSSKAGGIAVGSNVYTTQIQGRERSYRVYKPASLSASQTSPLVVVLHGALGTGEQAELAYGWDVKANAEGFVVAYPDGYKRTWAINSGCCGPAARDNIDDVAFIQQMVDDIADAVRVDKRQVYVTGISNGGMLAYRLACETDRFAAVGAVSATMLEPCVSPAPTSIMHIHGTADQTIPYAGGSGGRDATGQGNGPDVVNGPAIPDLMVRWRYIDDCGTPVSDTLAAVTTQRATCDKGRAVELITIAGAGHQWPGAKANPRAEQALGLDAPSTALNATDTLWQFFAGHPKP